MNVPKIHTDLLWELTLLFVGLAGFYFVAIFFYRNKLSASAKKIQQQKGELAPMISEFLFYDEKGGKEEKSNYITLKIEIRQLLKNDFNRKVLSEILLDLQKDVSGDTQKRLFRLYQDLGLEKDAYKKLQSWRWEVISKGILELTQMQVAESYVFITQFINDKRKTIRKQAEIATVTLKPEGIAYFLDTTKYRISEWQQLKLLDAIRKLEDFQPPAFKLWLTSKNGHVVLFALRLIKYYNQNDCNAPLIDLVKHKNGEIREEAIKCIKEFHVVGALDNLKFMYWKSSSAIKISILDAIGQLGSERDIEFLKRIENKEFNFSIKSKALSAINVISPESVLPIGGFQDIEAKSALQTPKEEFPAQKDGDTINSLDIASKANSNTMEESQEPEEVVDSNTLEELEAEVIATDTMSETKITVATQDELTDVGEANNVVDLNLLPVVVEEIGINSDNGVISQYRPGKTTVSKDLSEFEVVFEEVSINVLDRDSGDHIETERTLLNSNDLKETDNIVYDFTPIAMDNEMDDEAPVESELNSTCTLGTANIEVDFTEIASVPPTNENQNELPELEKEQCDHTKNIEVTAHELVEEIHKIPNEMSPTDHLKLKSIIEDLIVFENNDEIDDLLRELEEWPNLEWNMRRFDVEFVPLAKTGEDDPIATSTCKAEDDFEEPVNQDALEDKEINTLTERPSEENEKIINDIVGHGSKSIITQDPEEAKMQLLDDIEALGDQREIPLLTEFLEYERCSTVKERVKQLIAKFSRLPFNAPSPLRDANSSVYGNFKPFNIFEDLFRSSDTAKKLILMDEIVAVGDEKEIDFLKGLLEDSNVRIKKKAQKVLKALEFKLSKKREALGGNKEERANNQEKEPLVEIDGEVLLEYSLLLDEMEIAPPRNPDIFDVEFELSGQLVLDRSDPSEVVNNEQESFLNQLWSLPVKIMDKLNG